MCSFQYKVKRADQCGLLESFNIYMETDISAYDAIVMLLLLIIRILFNIVESVLLFPCPSYYIFLSAQYIFALVYSIALAYFINYRGENYVLRFLITLETFLLMAHPMNAFILRLLKHFFLHEVLFLEFDENVLWSEILGPFIRLLLLICESGLGIHRGRKLNESWMKHGAIALIIIIITLQRWIFDRSNFSAIEAINTNLNPELLFDSNINYVLDFIYIYSSFKIATLPEIWLNWTEKTKFVISDLK